MGGHMVNINTWVAEAKSPLAQTMLCSDIIDSN